ncbi:MAG: amidohydrolase family protein, partial [Pyrinomonadaceae bacterium]
ERNAGITAALSVPRDGIFIGQSAFINLADGSTREIVIKSPVALHISFNNSRPIGYPSSLMGVFSLFRQKLLDAQNYRQAQENYQRNPKGARRLDYDPQLDALLPVLSREMPIIFNANSEREIDRALNLAEEFNLRAIIAGGADSWKVIERLRALNVPVLLSLNYPKRTAEALAEADPESLEVLRSRVEAPKTAGKLAAAGIRFAFQSGGLTNINDYLANAAKSVESGLSVDQAVRGMTFSAAEILGLDQQLGTIEAGKIANLTVIKGSLFDKTRKITQLFIDGKQIELKSVTPATPEAPKPGTPTNQ